MLLRNSDSDNIITHR